MRLLKTSSIIMIVILVLIFAWNNLFISEQNREVTKFNSIQTHGPINVFIEQAEKESVRVRSDNNILDNLIVEVINGELKIYNRGRIEHERVLDVYVNFVTLNSICAYKQSTLTGRGEISVPKLKIEASGAAEVKLRVRSDSLDLVMNDAANVQLAGTTDYFNLWINHVGDLMAYNLVSQHCKAIVDTGDQSPGIARVNVEETFDININGPRFVKYKGNATITNQLIRGKGKLIKY